MKGYFSQLARQSGLRYGRAGATAAFAPNAKREIEKISAPHLEETILVASQQSAPPKKTPTKFSPPEIFSEDKPARKSEIKLTEKVSAEIPVNPRKSDAPSVAPNPEIVHRTIYSATEIKNETENPSSEKSAAVVPAEPIIVEKAIRAESAAIGEENVSESPLLKIETVRPETESPAAPPQQPEYFKKTAAHLKSGATDKLEIQQTLLQEIYEWASDAATTDDAPLADLNETVEIISPEPRPKHVIVAAPEEHLENYAPSEPGNAPNAANNTKPLEEQNFNLSIGTISIVVEEPLPVPSAAIQPTSVEKPAAKREYSRLSRYYL